MRMDKWLVALFLMAVVIGALLLSGTIAKPLFDALQVVFWVLVVMLVVGLIVWRLLF